MFRLRIPFAILIAFTFFPPVYYGQSIRVDAIQSRNSAKTNRERGIRMVKDIRKVIEEHYFDPNFRGIDLKARFKAAEEEIKTLETNSQIFRVIASLLLEFNDSHTRFFPPDRANRTEYGFALQMVGPTCFVVSVKKGSDAEAKGLKVGDVVTKLGPYPVNRDSLWVLNYMIYSLEPQPALPVYVKRPDGSEERILVQSKVTPFKEVQKEIAERRKKKREDPYKCAKLSSAVITCRLETFSVEKKFIDRMMTEVQGHQKFILDLRGNRGGYVHINQYLTGHFFDREVKTAEMVLRKKTETRIAKPVNKNQFRGELIVLIDSDSASASEVFSRVMQIEKRGTVVGDVSAGAVMTSIGVGMMNERGTDDYMTVSFYGLNVTVADVIMSDGKRLENVGVIPDHPVGPTAQALIERSDPVLAFAASLFGHRITSEEAGKLGFLKSKEEDEEAEKDEDG